MASRIEFENKYLNSITKATSSPGSSTVEYSIEHPVHLEDFMQGVVGYSYDTGKKYGKSGTYIQFDSEDLAAAYIKYNQSFYQSESLILSPDSTIHRSISNPNAYCVHYNHKVVDLRVWLMENKYEWTYGKGKLFTIMSDIILGLKFLFEKHKRMHGNLANGICIGVESDRAFLWRVPPPPKTNNPKAATKDFEFLGSLIQYLGNDKSEQVNLFCRFVNTTLKRFEWEDYKWLLNHPITWNTATQKRFISRLDFLSASKPEIDKNTKFIQRLKKGRPELVEYQNRFREKQGRLRYLLEIDINGNRRINEPKLSTYLHIILKHHTDNDVLKMSLSEIIDGLLDVIPCLFEELYECCYEAFRGGYKVTNGKKFLEEINGDMSLLSPASSSATNKMTA